MAVRIGGRELAMVYSAAVAAGRDGPAEIMEFRRMIQNESGADPEIGDEEILDLGSFDGPGPFPFTFRKDR